MNQAAPDLPIGGLEMGLFGAAGILGLIAFICGIVVVVKMCQNQQTALGIISLILMFCAGPVGHLIALVFGWMKSAEWNIKGLMLTYTASFVLSMVFLGAGYALLIPKILDAAQQQGMQMQEDFGDLNLNIEQ